MRMGPVLLRMMRGCPEKRQNKDPAMAVPRKLSITPWGHEECEGPQRREKAPSYLPGAQATVLSLYSRLPPPQILLPISSSTTLITTSITLSNCIWINVQM